eukprot:SAG31_NODE_34827_length_328_cov_28.550218_1_plen_49_part_10
MGRSTSEAATPIPVQWTVLDRGLHGASAQPRVAVALAKECTVSQFMQRT